MISFRANGPARQWAGPIRVRVTATAEAQVRLADAALAVSTGGRRDWGVCTECGMGRAIRGETQELLDLHRQIIAAG